MGDKELERLFKIIQKNIKQQMEHLGINQSRLAEKSGLDVSTISKLILGRLKHAEWYTLYKIAAALHTTIDSLIQVDRYTLRGKILPYLSSNKISSEEFALRSNVRDDAFKMLIDGRGNLMSLAEIERISKILNLSFREALDIHYENSILRVPIMPGGIDMFKGSLLDTELFYLRNRDISVNSKMIDIKDPELFAIKIEGGVYSPMIKDGDFLLVSPNQNYRPCELIPLSESHGGGEHFIPGDICLIRLSDMPTLGRLDQNRYYLGLIVENYYKEEYDNITIFNPNPSKPFRNRIEDFEEINTFKKDEISFIFPIIGFVYDRENPDPTVHDI